MKEYKTNEELLEYLIEKNIAITDKLKTLKILERYSYYSIINGYKFVFKERDTYIKNTSFDEIYALYEFDKNMKSIFLKYILEIEVIIKSLLANTISKQYGIKKYLKPKNFDEKANKVIINNFIIKLENEVKDNYIKHPAIKHYKDNYGFIPPFVLTKILTFGTISKYYSLLKQSDRQKISKYFKISDKLLKQILINLTLVRNISAHTDRLFNFRSKYDISFKSIEKNYNRKENLCNLYMISECIKLLLDKDKKIKFEKSINAEIRKLDTKLKVLNVNKILNIIGYNV